MKKNLQSSLPSPALIASRHDWSTMSPPVVKPVKRMESRTRIDDLFLKCQVPLSAATQASSREVMPDTRANAGLPAALANCRVLIRSRKYPPSRAIDSRWRMFRSSQKEARLTGFSWARRTYQKKMFFTSKHLHIETLQTTIADCHKQI